MREEVKTKEKERERERHVRGCCNQPSKTQCAPELGNWTLGIFGNPKLQTDWKPGVGVQGDTPAST